MTQKTRRRRARVEGRGMRMGRRRKKSDDAQRSQKGVDERNRRPRAHRHRQECQTNEREGNDREDRESSECWERGERNLIEDHHM